MRSRASNHGERCSEYLAGGMSVDRLLTDFPDLTEEDVRVFRFCG